MAPMLVQRSRTLLNKDLQKICRAEGVPTSGVKAQLQARVIELINKAVASNDHALFNRMQHHISGHSPAALPASPSYPPPRNPTTSSPNATNERSSMAQPVYGAGYQQPVPQARLPYHFNKSPFFEIRDLLLNNVTLETSPTHRQNISKRLTMNEAQCTRLRSDPTLRVLLFCALEQPLAPYTRLDVAFPSQIEVRVNQEEVKANYKGLKNKPGSTRPADITDLLRTTPANYSNNIAITYALTQKKYNMFVYMVRKFSVDELVKRIKDRSVITKDSVLREMRKKADDQDIEVGSSVMSLKDPISTLKIQTPCRSTLCTHNRCFDGESFLQLQEQAPTWQCPICNKTISFEALAVDEYVQDILATVSQGTDQVTVEPDGKWRSEKDPKPAGRQSNGNGYKSNGYEDDDDSEAEFLDYVPDHRLVAIKSEAVQTPQSLASLRTPPAPSREASSAPRTGTKRTSEVIDLTLSDDDEPPAKKVAYSTPNSVPDQARRYHLPSFSSLSSRSDGPRMNPPTQSRHSYGGYREPQSHPHRSYPSGQGSSTYPAYIDSSP